VVVVGGSQRLRAGEDRTGLWVVAALVALLPQLGKRGLRGVMVAKKSPALSFLGIGSLLT
jgi:hypothetical protein